MPSGATNQGHSERFLPPPAAAQALTEAPHQSSHASLFSGNGGHGAEEQGDKERTARLSNPLSPTDGLVTLPGYQSVWELSWRPSFAREGEPRVGRSSGESPASFPHAPWAQPSLQKQTFHSTSNYGAPIRYPAASYTMKTGVNPRQSSNHGRIRPSRQITVPDMSSS